MTARTWQNLWVRLAVALAFADASIVVLALPQLVDRLHSPISHVVWVIVAYNLALILAALAALPFARHLATVRALVAGLVLFGAASVGCGAANSLAALIPLRALQGIGGAVILCASLPLFAGTARPGDSPLFGWSAAAAIGAAVGPAAGGILTQVFDWRSIFFAQAPVAVFAAAAVLAARPRPVNELPDDEPVGTPPSRVVIGELTANLALTLLSAGLIGALFLIVIELINGWQISPIGAAAIVTTIPVSTALAERALRGTSAVLLGALGAVLVAAGLFVLAGLSYRELGAVVLGLALCGTGLGLAFPGLTAAALRSRGTAVARAAKTVAARDAGLVLGLLVLTPVFVSSVDAASGSATVSKAAGELIAAPLPGSVKFALVPGLQAAVARAPQSSPPDIGPVFAKASAGASPPVRAGLAALEVRLKRIIDDAVTHAFAKPMRGAAIFALLVLPLLALRIALARRSGPTG